jgi:hypothetical protein
MPFVWRDISRKLQTQPTVSVPEAGFALADLSRNASYDAAKNGTLGVPVLTIGGKLRVPSIAVLRRLGLTTEVTTTNDATTVAAE